MTAAFLPYQLFRRQNKQHSRANTTKSFLVLGKYNICIFLCGKKLLVGNFEDYNISWSMGLVSLPEEKRRVGKERRIGGERERRRGKEEGRRVGKETKRGGEV